jgi:hypothetical protein
MPADLHIHSTASDGSLAPEEVVRQAGQAGLTAISLTDHDTVSGLAAALRAGAAAGLKVIPGIELNTDLAGDDIHMLGYCLDTESEVLLRQIDDLRQAREDRARLIIAKLADLGMPLEYEDVRRIAGRAAIGRPHIARALLSAGYSVGVTEAFERYLARGRPAYVPLHKLDPFLAIEIIRKANGIPVLAHPGLARRDDLVAAMVDRGMLGLEVYYPFHTSGDLARYRDLCQKYGLIMTGGTDYHGPGFKYPPLGTVTVPDETVARLQEIAGKLRR